MSAPATPPTPATPSASTSPAVRVLAGGAAALPRGERVEVDTPAGVLVLTTPRRLNGRWEVARPGGAPALFQPGDPAQRARAAGAVGLGEADLFAAVAQAEAALRAPADEAVPAVFVITVASGAGEERREERVEAADPLAALDAALASGLPFLRWQGVERLVALDVDVRADGAGGRYADADAERALTRTGADAAWVTRSGGLRLMFGDSPTMTALDRALAGLVLGELGGAVSPEKVEAKADTRRPPAGAIVFRGSLAPDEATALVVARAGGRDQPGDVSEAAIDAWLDAQGLERGQRYEHDRCPIAPSPTSGNAPVMVGDEGIYCYRCQGVTGRGWRSWAALVERDGAEPEPDALVVAARSWVHVAHQRLVIGEHARMRLLPARVGREATDAAAWRAILRAVHAGALADPERRTDAEARLAAALDQRIGWVRSEAGVWLRSADLLPVDHSTDRALAALPWTGGHPVRCADAGGTGPLDGFRPVRVYHGHALRPDVAARDGVVAVQAPRRGEPCRRLDVADALPWADAWAVVAADFPGISEQYVRALLVAAACAEGGGQPVMLFASGASGSGKGGTAHLVAELLGGHHAEVDIADAHFARNLGAALLGGARFVVLDEAARVDGLASLQRVVLRIADPFYCEFKYVNAPIRVPVRAPMVMTGLDLPNLLTSDEVGRRVRVVKLPGARLDWSRTPLAGWRDHVRPEVAPLLDGLAGDARAATLRAMGEPDRARVADSLVAHAIAFAGSQGFRWRAAAAALGLAEADKADPAAAERRRGALVALYEHACGRLGSARPSSWSKYPGPRWVDLLAGDPWGRRIVEALAPDLDDGRKAHRALCHDVRALGAGGWARVLDVEGAEVRMQAGGERLVASAVEPGRPKGQERAGAALPTPGPEALAALAAWRQEVEGAAPPAASALPVVAPVTSGALAALAGRSAVPERPPKRSGARRARRRGRSGGSAG